MDEKASKYRIKTGTVKKVGAVKKFAILFCFYIYLGILQLRSFTVTQCFMA